MFTGLYKGWPSKPVNHLVTRFEGISNEEHGFTLKNSINSHVWDEISLRASAWAVLTQECNFYPADLVSASSFANTAPAGGLVVDYYSLYEKYLDNLNSITGQHVLLGEFLAEPGLIADAVMAVLRPKQAVKRFIEWGSASSIRRRNYSLAKAIRYYGKETASRHLEYIFGVKPLVQDLRNIWSFNRKAEKSLNFLMRNRGRYVLVGAQDKLVSPAGALPSPGSYYYVEAIKGYEDTTLTANMGAQGRVRTDLNRVSMWRAYSDYFGLGRVLDVAWELVPYSFVVDWFTNCGTKVHSLGRRNDPVFTEVKNFSVSTKLRTSVGVYVPEQHWRYMLAGENPISPTTLRKLLSYYSTVYHRDVSFRSADALQISFSKLGLWHLITSGSLIVQKIT